MLKEAQADRYDSEYYLKSCGGAAEYDTLLQNLYAEPYPLPFYDKACKLGFASTNRTAKLMVDIGCGRGEMLALYAAHGWLSVGVDFSPDALNICQRLIPQLPLEVSKNVSLVCSNAKSLPFEDDSVDVVLMLDIVEHINQADLIKVIADVKRVLRPGGLLVVHTQPTLNFIKYGQHLYRLLCKVSRRPVPAIVSLESEEKYARHCNIQSKASLEEAMAVFSQKEVYYSFSVSNSNSTIKTLLRKTGLIGLITRNLWAIGHK